MLATNKNCRLDDDLSAIAFNNKMNNNRYNSSKNSIKKNRGMEKEKRGNGKKKLRTQHHQCSWYIRVTDIKLKLKFYCYQRGLVQHPEICHELKLAIFDNKHLFKYI
jgi:hypothetical protein